jgi:hypothetical protein
VKEFHRFVNTETSVEMERSGSKISFKEYGLHQFKIFSYPEHNQELKPVYVRPIKFFDTDRKHIDESVGGCRPILPY